MRSGTARQHRGHLPCPGGNERTDLVDSALDRPEPAHRHAAIKPPRTQTGIEQLSPRDEPVLTSRKTREQLFLSAAGRHSH